MEESSTNITDADDQVDLIQVRGRRANKLGTIEGVFTPVCLAMFSAILFLRLGYIVGNAGLLETLLQMLIAYTILIFTVLSVSAISTNGAIEGGGIYYMTSRVLGPEFGGSLGILFFVANIVSAALYLKGCVEGLMNSFGEDRGTMANFLPGGDDKPLVYASIINLFNLIICIFGASMFAKTTLFIFIIVVLVALSIIASLLFQKHTFIFQAPDNHLINATVPTLEFTGFNINTLKSNLYSNYSIDYTSRTDAFTDFSTVFGVFFTGVTGVLAGANISGDLKNPSRSIPVGTLAGIAFTFVIYATLFILTAATCSRELLLNNYLYMQEINFYKPLVEIGISAATISAALTNLIGASRLLNAISADKLFGFILNPIYRANVKGNPIGSVLLTWFFIQSILLIQSLNQIAQLSSILFMFTYFSLSVSCMMLIVISTPNFRPAFKYYNLFTALIGLLGALSMMFIVQPLYSSAAIIIWMILMIGIHFISPPVRWGDISQALIFHQVRKYLLLLDSRKEHVKYWRPRILLLVENPKTCLPLVEFTNDLKKSGLFVIGHVELGSLDDYIDDPINEAYLTWLKWLDQFTIKAFIELTLARTVREGVHHITRISGIGTMKLNTVILGFYDDVSPINFLQFTDRYKNLKDLGIASDDKFFDIRGKGRMSKIEYVSIISDLMDKLDKTVCLARNFYHLDVMKLGKQSSKYHIDVWPIDFFNLEQSAQIDNCAKLIMQLACILHMVPRWKQATTIRLMICSNNHDQQILYELWQRMLNELRIDAGINIIICNHIFNKLDVQDLANSSSSSIMGQSSRPNLLPRSQYESAALTAEYISALNEMFKERSETTAITFMYLPRTPSKMEDYANYLSNLQRLTEGLPPTLLVHGTDHVVSTSI